MLLLAAVGSLIMSLFRSRTSSGTEPNLHGDGCLELLYSCLVTGRSGNAHFLRHGLNLIWVSNAWRWGCTGARINGPDQTYLPAFNYLGIMEKL
ncbi:hypothetical protein GGS20DRAFT_562564 [Poronia punctata]|nr:hypothetical protein GGS20DRAFT_562564 [Poronia punctata]